MLQLHQIDLQRPQLLVRNPFDAHHLPCQRLREPHRPGCLQDALVRIITERGEQRGQCIRAGNVLDVGRFQVVIVGEHGNAAFSEFKKSPLENLAF